MNIVSDSPAPGEPMTDPEKFDFAREARELAEAWAKELGVKSNVPHRYVPLWNALPDRLEAALRRAYAAGQESMREAAAIGAHDFLIGARDCPYGRDKPGDPTWNHTEEDICPVCKKNGQDSATHCVETPSGRVAAAIRALPLEDKL